MSETLQKLKEKYPQYEKVDDGELALRIGTKFPTYLDHDPEFKKEFQTVVATRAMNLAQKGITSVIDILGNPAVGEASEAGRQQIAEERTDEQAKALESGMNVAIQATSTVLKMVESPAAAEASAMGREQLAKKRTASEALRAAYEVAALPPGALEGKASFEAGKKFTDPFFTFPRVDANDPAFRAFLSGAMGGRAPSEKEAGTVAGLANTGKGFVEFFETPQGMGTAVTGAGPTWLQKVVGGVWGVVMGKHAPEAAREFGKATVEGTTQQQVETGMDLASSVIFPALIGKHMVARPKTPLEIAFDNAKGVAPLTADAVRKTDNIRFLQEGTEDLSTRPKVDVKLIEKAFETPQEAPEGKETPAKAEKPAETPKAEEAAPVSQELRDKITQIAKPITDRLRKAQEKEDIAKQLGDKDLIEQARKERSAIEDEMQDRLGDTSILTVDTTVADRLASGKYEWVEGYGLKKKGAPAAAPGEVVTASSYTHPETGKTTTGANHIEAAKEQGVTIPEERTARETPEYGFEVQDQKTGKTRYVTREEGEKIARETGQLTREPITGKMHSDEVTFEPRKETPDAIHRKAETPVRDVQQPTGAEEGAGEVPADEAGKEAGKGSSEVPQKAHELSAADVAKIPAEKFKAYRDELGKDTEARQTELAKTTPMSELEKHAKAAMKEYEAANKAAQKVDVQEDPDAAQEAMNKANAAAIKVQFFNETLQRVPGEVKTKAARDKITAQIEQAMQLGRTRKLSAAQRSAISQGIEAARQGDPEKLQAAIEDAKKAEQVKGEQQPRGFPGRTRFDRETELGGPDILSWINENMKLLSKSAAKKIWGKEKFQANKSLWDDAPSVWGSNEKKAPHHNIIYSEKGSGPDTVAQAAYEAGLLTEPSVNELWDALKKASAARTNIERTVAREQRSIKQQEAWSEATKTGKIELTTEDVAIGDMLEVAGEKLKVTEREPTGEVTLQGGEKFGTQILREGEPIYVDKFEPVEKGEAEFAPEEEAKPEEPKAAEPAEAAPAEDARRAEAKASERALAQQIDAAAEKQAEPVKASGELFSKEETPFNLMGEKAQAAKAPKTPEQQPDLLAEHPGKDNPISAEPKEAEVEKPKVEERALTKSEQKEFTELSKIAKANREEGGPALTSEQTQRYEELGAIAGQKEFNLKVKAADDKAAEQVHQEKKASQQKIQEEQNRKEDEIETNPKPTDTTTQSALLRPPDSRTPKQILGEAKRVKVKVPKSKVPEAKLMIRITDEKGHNAIIKISDINKGPNIVQGVKVKTLEAGTIGKDKKFHPMNEDVTVQDVTPRSISGGPGAASPDDFPEDSPLKQLTDTLKAQEPLSEKAPLKQRVREALDIKEKWARGKEDTLAALGGMKAVASALADRYKNLPGWTDFKAALGRWTWADAATAIEVRNFQREIQRSVPQKIRQEAITNWIQAGGDEAVLQARAVAAKPRFKRSYETALTLNDAEKTLAAQIQMYFESRLAEGIEAGLLRSALENYVTQIWKRPALAGAKLMADLFGGGTLNPSFKFARHRIFQDYFEGEQAGFIPKNKAIGHLLSVYDLSFNRSLSARTFIKELNNGVAKDGLPIAEISKASIREIEGSDASPEGTFLLKPNLKTRLPVAADGRPYLPHQHWALKGWRWAITGTRGGFERPVLVEGDMLIHPDHFDHLSNVLTRSKIAQIPALNMLLKGAAFAKQTKLSLSPFHLTQEAVHGLTHKLGLKVLPSNLEDINPHDPITKTLMEHGLMVADPRAMELFSEGMSGGGLVKIVPGLGKAQIMFNEWLFKDYIPKLKLAMAKEAFARNSVVYAEDISSGKITLDQLTEHTANEANAAFGELNYRMLGRNQTLQDFWRLTLLAPDFLEARARFVGQALKPYGSEQKWALIRMGATLFIGSRILNQILDGDMHLDQALSKQFSVFVKGKEYRLRTVLGDVIHAFTEPRQFWYNRFSPALRTLIEYATSRDDRGIKRNSWEQMLDFAKWFEPISVQSFLPGGRSDIGPIDQALTSGGIAVTQATQQRRIYDIADKWMEKNKDPKIKERYDRFKAETHVDSPYTPLRHALQRDDIEDARKEYKKLLETRTKDQIRTVLHTVRPFTGSAASELKFKRSLSPSEMKIYEAAVKERRDLYKKFQKMLSEK